MGKTQGSDLYIAYKAWCMRFNQACKSDTKVARDWKRLGVEKTKDGYVYYLGFSLTPAAEAIVADERRKEHKHR